MSFASFRLGRSAHSMELTMFIEKETNMRVIEPEIDEQVINSGWTTTLAVLMIVLGITA